MTGVIASKLGEGPPHRVITADDTVRSLLGKDSGELELAPAGDAVIAWGLGFIQNQQRFGEQELDLG